MKLDVFHVTPDGFVRALVLRTLYYKKKGVAMAICDELIDHYMEQLLHTPSKDDFRRILEEPVKFFTRTCRRGRSRFV
jgi:hypothetical protein